MIIIQNRRLRNDLVFIVNTRSDTTKEKAEESLDSPALSFRFFIISEADS